LYIRQLSNKIKVISIIYQRISGLSSIYSDKLKITKKLRDYDSKNIPQFDNKFNKILYYQHKGGLVNLLHYGDAISMANSIETRLPFMDYRLVEFAFKLPWHFKFHEDYGKYIHRQAMKNICPDSILENNIKLGFNTPLSLLFNLKNDLEVKPKDILLSEKCLSRGLFNEYYLRKTFETHEKGIKNHSTLLYRLLCTELWFREFID
ncbi:MAG: asparagine synthase-related protein, partial [Saprospiraceae bacterium]